MATVFDDPYAGLSHKAGMSEAAGESPITPYEAWAPEGDRRRLMAYALYRALIDTVGREYLGSATTPERREAWRELGDTAALTGRVAAAILGEDPLLMIDGADEPVPDFPDFRPPPTDPYAGDSDTDGQETGTEPPGGPPGDAGGETPDDPLKQLQASIYAEALRVWEETEQAKADEWLKAQETLPRLKARQEALRDWDTATGAMRRIVENEEEFVVPLGDGLLALGYSAGKLRPEVKLYTPDTYFPVITGRDPGEWPTEVHFVWPFVQQDSTGSDVDMVRRITYRLVTAEDQDYVQVSPKWTDADGQAPPAPTTCCLYSDVVYEAKDFDSATGPAKSQGEAASFTPVNSAEVELRDYPIGLPFIPVVHFPYDNTSVRHFGRSYLARLVQILDEIAAQDTDASLCSRWAARPPLAVSGMGPGQDTLDVTPGKAFRLGENGRISTIEMARNLSTVLDRGSQLLKRLSVNGQVPEGLLGRVDASEVPSGLALTLSFTPFEQLVRAARRARDPKFALFVEMLQKIGIQNDWPALQGDNRVYPGGLQYGTFMPQDLSAAVAMAVQLRSAKLTSQRTGIAYLQEEGYLRVDPDAEIEAIRAEDGETANLISEATGDSKYGAEYLGIDDYEAPEAVDPDGAAGAPPAGADPFGGAFDDEPATVGA